MTQYLLVKDNAIADVVVWDGTSPWTPPDGYQLVAYSGAAPASAGFGWDGTNPILPPPPAPALKSTASSKTGPAVVN